VSLALFRDDRGAEPEPQFGDVLQVVGQEDRMVKLLHCGQLAQGSESDTILPLLQASSRALRRHLAAAIRVSSRCGWACQWSLIVAILVSRVGRIGPLVWHMPLNANLAFREFGIALFFASVGLMAGPQFFAVVFSVRGAIWLASGICVTMLPILFVGWLALAIWKMNFVVVWRHRRQYDGSASGRPLPTSAAPRRPVSRVSTVYPLTT
jgi:uncharacterized transporter YbjL